jgi:O-antigen ligase
MEEIALRHKFDITLTDANIVIIAACSIFLPYILAAFILFSLSLYITLNKNTRKYIFVHSGTKAMKLFFAYVLIIPMLYRNWLGILVGICMILAFQFGLYLRSVMTRELYERVLSIICILSLSSSIYVISENVITSLVNHSYSIHRASAMFFHPNYYGTIIGTVIIICVYKILSNQGSAKMFYGIAVTNILSMYLCKSMFVWVEVFVGVTVLLIVFKKYRLLIFWLCAGVVGSILILGFKMNVIPRLDDVENTTMIRIKVWKAAIQEIKRSPLFGHGFMSFLFISPKYYNGQLILHTHSIYLDMLINFGVLGTVLFVWYFVKYYISVAKQCFKKKNTMITSLILAVTAAALVHGSTDITLLWIQTLPLFLLILSGLGVYEEKEENIRYIAQYIMIKDHKLSKAS